MLIKRGGGFEASEVTPHSLYLNRRAIPGWTSGSTTEACRGGRGSR